MKPTYESPLASRYASKTMLHLFSPDMRYETWRRLWVALARAEHTLGLPITQAQVDELAAHVSPNRKPLQIFNIWLRRDHVVVIRNKFRMDAGFFTGRHQLLQLCVLADT